MNRPQRPLVLRRMVAAAGAALAAASAAACPATRPLTVVVPYAAGGSSDATTRLLASELARELGRRVIVRNVPGASGLIAVTEVLGAARDGCTLFSGSANNVLLVPLRNARAGFAASDLRPLAKTGSTELMLIATRRLPAQDVAGLAGAARAASRPLAAGHPGQESLQAIALGLLARRQALPLNEIPYSGSAPLATDLVAGHLDIAVVAAPAALPLIRRGDVRLLGVIDRLPGFEHLASWAGWFVAAATPPQASAATAEALQRVLAQPRVRQALDVHGVRAAEPHEHADFARVIERDAQRFADLPSADRR